jgi:hypothetical protein
MKRRGTSATTEPGFTVECAVHFGQERRGRKRLREGEEPIVAPVEPGTVPRVARLLALAHRFDGLLDRGDVANYADLARIARVSRPRMTQIMHLLLLAPDIQEEILFLPLTVCGRAAVTERALRGVVAEPEWGRQRRMWSAVLCERMGVRML